MPLVFAVHPPVKVDYGPAKQYGDLRYVNSRYVFTDELEQDHGLPRGFVSAMVAAAARFNRHEDFLLQAGDTIQVMAMTVYLAQANPWFRVLRYDRAAKGYAPVMLGGPIG